MAKGWLPNDQAPRISIQIPNAPGLVQWNSIVKHGKSHCGSALDCDDHYASHVRTVSGGRWQSGDALYEVVLRCAELPIRWIER
jgi:hypothetical protein